MRVMYEPIENRVAKRGVTDQVVPVVDRHLAGHQRGTSTRSIFHDFEQIAAFSIAQGREAPVVQDEQVGFGELLEHAPIRAVAAGRRKIAQEARESHVAHRRSLATRGVSERAGQPAFSRAGRTDEQ